MGAKAVEDLKYIFEDNTLLKEVQGGLREEEFQKFLKCREKTLFLIPKPKKEAKKKKADKTTTSGGGERKSGESLEDLRRENEELKRKVSNFPSIPS